VSEVSIPVDLLNPGHVFACLGFAEAADVLLGEAAGVFDWSSGAQVRFVLRAAGDTDPIATVLQFLAEAQVVALLRHGSPLGRSWTASWGAFEVLGVDEPYPMPEPVSPATVPARLRAGGRTLVMDHWGDGTSRRTVKLWAGSGGYPGAGLARDALALIRTRCVAAAADPFALAASQSSSFRFDWRRDYIPIDAGFSVNNHSSIDTVGYPLVELLAELGLGMARPLFKTKLDFRYGVIGRARDGTYDVLPLGLLRAALGGPELPFPMRRFRMKLGWPGKEGQARSITTVTEEAT